MTHPSTILVVDDEPGVRQSFSMLLKSSHQILLAENGEEAIRLFRKNTVDLVLLDIMLPDTDGIELLRRFKDLDPGTQVVMVTAVADVQTAVTAIKEGAYEYIMKPFNVDDVLAVIDRALEKRRLEKEVAYLRNELKRMQPFERMVGHNAGMQAIFDLISTVSKGVGAVLILGESGTGKELAARAIHNRGPRRECPFVVVNCAAIPETLMESELFGHARGAFTGATAARIGKLELADTGTVFLDDIDSLDVQLQAKLLRVIQEKEFQRVGSNKIINVDVRFIAASNKNLGDLIERGEFRQDLFYRLNVFPVELPPLRKRRDDIPLLVDHFLDMNAARTGLGEKRFSARAHKMLVDYDWPGNVRELENMVERLYTITPGETIRQQHMSPFSEKPASKGPLTLKEAVRAFEQQYIEEVIDSVDGNRSHAARLLGIHRNTLLSKLG